MLGGRLEDRVKFDDLPQKNGPLFPQKKSGIVIDDENQIHQMYQTARQSLHVYRREENKDASSMIMLPTINKTTFRSMVQQGFRLDSIQDESKNLVTSGMFEAANPRQVGKRLYNDAIQIQLRDQSRGFQFHGLSFGSLQSAISHKEKHRARAVISFFSTGYILLNGSQEDVDFQYLYMVVRQHVDALTGYRHHVRRDIIDAQDQSMPGPFGPGPVKKNNTVKMFQIPHGVDLNALSNAYPGLIRRVETFPPAMMTVQTNRRPMRSHSKKSSEYCLITTLIFRHGGVLVLGTVDPDELRHIYIIVKALIFKFRI
jgi:hypothetical protein